MSRGILLVGHGSRDQAGNAQFLELSAAVRERLDGLMLQPCFLDHVRPTVADGIAALAARGAVHIGVVPLFLFAAGHAKQDVPSLLTAAAAVHPHVEFTYGRPLGVHRDLVRACARELAEPAGSQPGRRRSDTAVLLVGRGSSDPEANDGLRETARLLQVETGFGAVQPAFCDVAQPSVAAGLEQALRTGARRVVLLPYFLFRGVLMERLKRILSERQAASPETEFQFAAAGGLGVHPEVLNLIVQRAAEVSGVPSGR